MAVNDSCRQLAGKLMNSSPRNTTTNDDCPDQGVRIPVWTVFVVLFSVVGVHLLIESVFPDFFSGYLTSYIVRPLLWCAVVVITLLVTKRWAKENLHTKSSFIWVGLLVGSFQVAVFVIAGLFLGFGKSPYSFTITSMLLNLGFMVSALLGMEFSRAYFIKALSKKHETIALLSIAILYTAISIPLLKLTSIEMSTQSMPFFGETLLPLFTQNLLACVLVLVGGPFAAIAYMGSLAAFEWFCPILPDLPWIITAFIGTITPIMGLIMAQIMAAPAQPVKTTPRTKRRIPLSGVATCIICVIMLWATFGLFGFSPILVAGHSMEPSMDLGDIAIITDASPGSINVGDVIQFEDGNSSVIHRVIDIQEQGGSLFFITQGDNNRIADSMPVSAEHLMGRVVFAIPKIGWISIGIKNLIN